MSNEKEKMSDLAALEMTEKRLEELERRVYGTGSGDSANTRKDEFSTPLVPKLAGKCYYISIVFIGVFIILILICPNLTLLS